MRWNLRNKKKCNFTTLVPLISPYEKGPNACFFQNWIFLEVCNVLYTLLITHWESKYLSWSCSDFFISHQRKRYISIARTIIYAIHVGPLSPITSDRFREKRPNACFFKILIFYRSEMWSTHCFLPTENRSICHGVVRLWICQLPSTQALHLYCAYWIYVLGPFSRKRSQYIESCISNFLVNCLIYSSAS